MEESILTSIKKLLGIAESYKQFDTDIVIHINSVFAILSQLGLGPDEGFEIEDSTATWSDYIDSDDMKLLSSIKTYIYLKVRSYFDPPTSGTAMDAISQQVKELEWRLNVAVDPDTSSSSE